MGETRILDDYLYLCKGLNMVQWHSTVLSGQSNAVNKTPVFIMGVLLSSLL
ncbi:hypothetical protein BTHERMOSOX_77 [Bathymodiolus thermophilus thioautotrophic gill symbiont]|nr:hypothetical protein BTHERMOSOX_77 [Bathymodiolus thermophilus thioautotrophic gill symbiont]